MENTITLWCLLGGNPNRYKALKNNEEKFNVIMSGFPHEVDEFLKNLKEVNLHPKWYQIYGNEAFDTVTNFAFDIKSSIVYLKRYDEIILLTPTSPTHFWRCQKIVKMLAFFYPIFRKVRLEKVESYEEDDGPLEPMMRNIYRFGGWLGILSLCLVARLQRIGKN